MQKTLLEILKIFLALRLLSISSIKIDHLRTNEEDSHIVVSCILKRNWDLGLFSTM